MTGSRPTPTTVITLPGIHGSDAEHWQSRWEAADPRMKRFQPSSWDEPDLQGWKHALTGAVATSGAPVVLVVHSLANLLLAHWVADAETDPRHVRAVAGAFLVSVPDPAGPAFPPAARGFADAPRTPLPFPALVVTSSTDPFGSVDHQREVALDWQAGWVCVGDHGHLNSSSRLGDWPAGRNLLTAFVSGLGGTSAGPAS